MARPISFVGKTVKRRARDRPLSTKRAAIVKTSIDIIDPGGWIFEGQIGIIVAVSILSSGDSSPLEAACQRCHETDVANAILLFLVERTKPTERIIGRTQVSIGRSSDRSEAVSSSSVTGKSAPLRIVQCQLDRFDLFIGQGFQLKDLAPDFKSGRRRGEEKGFQSLRRS